MNCCTPLNCCRSFHYLSTGEVPYIQFANNCSLKLKQRTPENLLKEVKLYKNKQLFHFCHHISDVYPLWFCSNYSKENGIDKIMIVRPVYKAAVYILRGRRQSYFFKACIKKNKACVLTFQHDKLLKKSLNLL